MLVFIRGAGDLATGISIRLYRAGISVCHSDLAIPTAVRRNVAFSEAIRLGECSVEGITAVRAESLEEIYEAISQKKVPVVVDEGKSFLHRLQADAVVEECSLRDLRFPIPAFRESSADMGKKGCFGHRQKESWNKPFPSVLWWRPEIFAE